MTKQPGSADKILARDATLMASSAADP